MTLDYPDFYSGALIGKPQAISGQSSTLITVNEDVPASSSTTVTLYTVPTGKDFYITSGSISCEASCIQKFELYTGAGATLWYSSHFDIKHLLIDALIGTGKHSAGYILKMKIYNNDTVQRNFVAYVWGNEVPV